MTKERHPPAGDLRALVSSGPGTPATRTALHHLVEGCPTCCAAVEEEARQLVATVPRLTPDDYEAPLRRAYSKVRRHARALRKQVERAGKAVVLLKEGGTSRFVAKWPQPLWNMAEYLALLEGATATLAENPREAAKMASLAYAISLNLNPEIYGPELVHDLQARAAAEKANAFRAADLLAEAEEHFAEAFDLAARGTGSLWLRGHLLSLVASLHAAQRRWIVADSALEAAAKIFLSLGVRHHAGKVHIQRALYQNNHGDSEAAIATNCAGLKLIDPEADSKLAVMARYNQILFLVDSEKYRAAERAIFEGRREFEASLGRVEKLKLIALEGKVDAGLGRFPSAERRLTEARDGFSELEMKFAAALISLELSHVCLRWKKARAASGHAFDAEASFRELKIYREQIVAVAILAECFRQRVATPKLVQDVIAFVSRAEHNPGKTFELRPV